MLLTIIILLQLGCCSNAFFQFGTVCEATSEVCDPNERPPLPPSNEVAGVNGGASAVLYSVVIIIGSLLFAGLALMF
jgi:hypothetical protein